MGTGWYLRERDIRAKRERQQELLRLDRRRRLIAASPAESLVTAAAATSGDGGVLADCDGDGVVGSYVSGTGDGGMREEGRAVASRRTALSERLARGIPVLGATW